jgi:hypothetical protein
MGIVFFLIVALMGIVFFLVAAFFVKLLLFDDEASRWDERKLF